MKLRVIVTDHEGGEQPVEFEGPEVQFMPEPSGVLMVLEKPNRPWAVFAPGQWLEAYRVRSD